MKRVRVVGLVFANLVLAHALVGQGIWLPPAQGCDLSSGHFKVNSAQLYLKSAYEKNNKDRDLKDAFKVLNEAINMNGQDKNPAAWYYLGRYYVATTDLAGADSAFTKAEALAPKCQADIRYWRQFLWTPIYNAGVAALNAGKNDSALASFHRANLIYRSGPESFMALGILYFNTQVPDSAAKYFKAAAEMATEPKYAVTKKTAMFNAALAFQQAGRNPEAVAAFQEYLKSDPNDAQAMASLATLYARMGQKDSATNLYKVLIQRADSVDPLSLFQAGVDIYAGAPPYPDTAAIGTKCRSREGAKKPSRPGMTAAQRQSEIAKTCNAENADSMKVHQETAAGSYQVAADAFHAVLKHTPEFRDALFNLTEVYFALDDADSMLAVSRRLVAVDPLNRTSMRLHAQAWQLKGQQTGVAPTAAKAYRDSAYKYVLSAADSIPVEVTVDSFRPQEQGASVAGKITNFHEQGSSAPVSIVVEFLAGSGTVVGSNKVPVPALAAGASQPFSVQVIGKGITAFRYRKE